MDQTPKEKAIELYQSFHIDYVYGMNSATARTFALLCVDEIIKANPCYHDEDFYPEYWSSLEYWQKVKQELQKI